MGLKRHEIEIDGQVVIFTTLPFDVPTTELMYQMEQGTTAERARALARLVYRSLVQPIGVYSTAEADSLMASGVIDPRSDALMGQVVNACLGMSAHPPKAPVV